VKKLLVDILTVALGLAERLVALVCLITVLPALLLTGFVLCTNSDQPVLVVEEVLTGDGIIVRSHRFRTTGRGNAAFRVVGRFLRFSGWDEFPALWSVLRGDMRLRQLLRRR
jgi:lipopolysaccharide/colanic/teichoic acid biosynthesis glycosyltransferase